MRKCMCTVGCCACTKHLDGSSTVAGAEQVRKPANPVPVTLVLIQVASDAVAEARAICFREYGSAPQVSVCVRL